MESHILDWLNLVIRWFHMIVGIAWIGASFYFVWLDNSLRPPVEKDSADKGVGGEVWAVHGGGFYRIEKYAVSPEKLPKTLHWFKWDAYLTWISGVLLLTVIYYFGAKSYLMKPGVEWLTPWLAIGISIGSLVLTWFLYDLLCRSPLGKHQIPFSLVIFGLITAGAYGLTQVFAVRAAYIHVGAMIGTIMAINVFAVIIPNQKKSVAAMQAGESPDPKLGIMGKQRSLHNNYFTLPLLFIMVSNHYPFTYGHKWSWAVLAGLAVGSVAVRHYINMHEKGLKLYWLLPTAAVVLLALVFVTKPRSAGATVPGARQISYAKEIEPVIKARCVSCHSVKPTDDTFKVAPQGAMFDTPDQVKRLVAKIKARTVDSPTMPLGNKTKMTDAERALLGQWIAQGADVTK